MDSMTLIYNSEEQDEHVPYSVGRQYIMDWRGSFPKEEHLTEALPKTLPVPTAKEQPSETQTVIEAHSEDMLPEDAPVEATTEEIPMEEAVHSPRTVTAEEYEASRSVNTRLAASLILTALGMAAGAAAAVLFPAGGADFTTAMAASEAGGFIGIVSRQMAVCTAFAAAEYLLGYWAVGGFIVWLLPLLFGAGCGISAAGAFLSGANQWAAVFCILYGILNAYAAYNSWELSAYIMDAVSAKGKVITEGGTAQSYSVKFACYLGFMLLLSVIEAAIKINI